LLLLQVTALFVALAGATVSLSCSVLPIASVSELLFNLTEVTPTVTDTSQTALFPPSSVVTVIRIVKKDYNRRKSDQSLYEVRDNLKLERLFVEKKNKIKLQDIFELKDISQKAFHFSIKTDTITVDDGTDKRIFTLLFDKILNVQYFYGRIPIKWLENDDQQRRILNRTEISEMLNLKTLKNSLLCLLNVVI